MRHQLEITRGKTTQFVAALFALSAFAVAVVAGLGAGANAARTLLVGLVAMGVCHVLGTFIGSIAERTASEALNKYKQDRPVPDLLSESDIQAESEPDSSPESVQSAAPEDKISMNQQDMAQAA